MDDIVKRAMIKWPNVPHCYGWLALDARGNWRMRDERAQHENQLGDKIVHAALLGFINRNYLADDMGRWYFQNGPQRVFVNLESTPFIARTDPADGLVLHTGEALSAIEAVWLTDTAKLVVQAGGRIAQIDDRDLQQCLPWLRLAGSASAVDDQFLLDWIADPSDARILWMTYGTQHIAVSRLHEDSMASHFGFVLTPQPD